MGHFLDVVDFENQIQGLRERSNVAGTELRDGKPPFLYVLPAECSLDNEQLGISIPTRS
jgi:hypothetical protein